MCSAHIPTSWLFTLMDCLLLWTSRTQDFRRAFSLVPEYLRTSESVDSLSDYGLALRRRFRALKLWAVLRCDGPDEENEEILERVNRSGELFSSQTRLAWEPVSGLIENMICTMYA